MVADSRVAIYSNDNRANIPVYPLDVFVLTDRGTAEIHSGPTNLPATVLELLVLLDGKITVGDVEQKAQHIPPEELRNLLRSMIAAGLIRAPTIAETDGFDFDSFLADDESQPEFSDGSKASAEQEAGSGGPQLVRDGYYVSIARKAVKARAPGAPGKIDIFMVEDDPDVSALVRKILEDAGFAVSVAPNREAIVARLRKEPFPDLAILDVMLPDTNGFDVLQRMKLHPRLKTVPVIMLTADARRESVMRGLVAGADGYMTKPFERSQLLAGVNAVLGIGG